VVGGWILIVAMLLMLGWATRTLGSFDERVIVTWIAVTPVALFTAHMLVPVLLPRVMASEGIQRVAVIAGAGALGRKLAEQIESTPFLGVRVAGFFDDRSADRSSCASASRWARWTSSPSTPRRIAST
jgi:putative colanic acid biosynthesis UDP-glucose lipid carrier transferase